MVLRASWCPLARLAVLVFGLLCCTSALADPSAPQAASSAREFRVWFASFQASGVLSAPAGAAGRPAVILLQGSGPTDLDGSVFDVDGQLESQDLRVLSDGLTAAGFVVVRFNKRYVTGPGEDTAPGSASVTEEESVQDAGTVLRWTQQQPEVDPDRVSVLGWSEGSIVAQHLALRHREIWSTVLLAPVTQPWAQVLWTQFERVTLPALTRLADTDGQLSVQAVAGAFLTPGGGNVLRTDAGLLLADDAPLRFRTELGLPRDRVSPGVLEERARRLFLDVPEVLGVYASGLSLPALTTLPPPSRPTLVVQGGRDAHVDPAASERYARASGSDWRSYPALGHALGLADAPESDTLAPIRPEVVADIVAWLREHCTGCR